MAADEQPYAVRRRVESAQQQTPQSAKVLVFPEVRRICRQFVFKGQHREDQIDFPRPLKAIELIFALKAVEASVTAALADLPFGSY